MVERCARDVRWMFAAHLELQDLTQAGTVGLVKAANAFQPALASKAGFDAYAWFRVRGAIIDSQKRRVYREEQNESLDKTISRPGDATARTLLDVLPDARPLPDAEAERNARHQLLAEAIASLPEMERRVLKGQLDGQSLAVTAEQVGKSITWTRAKLAEAREAVGAYMRDE